MSYLLHFINEPNYLRVNMSGNWTAPNAETAFKTIQEEADKRGVRLLLFDGRKLPQSPGDMTRFCSGQSLAKYLPTPYRIAIWRKPEQVDRLLENVAVNRGARVQVFASEEEAVKWLLSE